MAASLLALLDDIASVLDDVALMSKVAAKKTAGVLGDDLALNAQQVSGVQAERELPVVWAVAKGSLLNKVILVPAALLISHFLPQAIVPLLMIGGAFLCFEGCEKLAHKFLHSAAEDAANEASLVSALADSTVDLRTLEQDKIKGAIRTDFILSAEIIVITLGTVAGMPFLEQLGVLVVIALVMTLGVYGVVAGIVKIDDAGLYLSKKSSSAAQALGRMLLAAAPRLMKLLTIVGTIAMFMVGGGIIGHNWAPLHHFATDAAARMAEVATIGPLLAAVTPTVIDVVAGVIVGALVLLVVTIVTKIRGSKAH